MNKLKGVVYFVRLGTLSYYKIGFTRDLASRITGISEGLPLPLELVASAETKNANEIEKALHHKFSAKCTKGEWFELSKIDVEFIKHALEILDKSKSNNYRQEIQKIRDLWETVDTFLLSIQIKQAKKAPKT